MPLFYSVTLFDHLGNTTCDGHFLSEEKAQAYKDLYVNPRGLRFVKVWSHFTDPCTFCGEKVIYGK